MITLLDVAKARGIKETSPDVFAYEAFEAVGIPMLGGCLLCAATIAAYNAYPTRTGYIMCKSCAEQDASMVFETTEQFELYELEHEPQDTPEEEYYGQYEY